MTESAMDLFRAAGLDLPGGAHGARRRPLPQVAVAPLFAAKVIDKALGLTVFNPATEQLAAAKDYARRARSAGFAKQGETKVRQLFFEQILGKVLGYTQYDPDRTYTLGLNGASVPGPSMSRLAVFRIPMAMLSPRRLR